MESTKRGCMNCGNITCPNNKKRDCAGCGRWISPEDKIAELEEKVGMAERTRDRLIAIGFPTFASCKEYSAKLKELEQENSWFFEYIHDLKKKVKRILEGWYQSSMNNGCDIVTLETETEKLLEELDVE